MDRRIKFDDDPDWVLRVGHYQPTTVSTSPSYWHAETQRRREVCAGSGLSALNAMDRRRACAATQQFRRARSSGTGASLQPPA